MTTKQYLMQIKRYERMINNKLTEIYRLRQLASSISISNDSENVMSSGSMDRMGDSVAKIVDLERNVKKMIGDYTEIRQKIIMQIDSIPDTNHYSVLSGKYILCESFEKIADDIGYSSRQVIRIHGEALREFEKMYGQTYLSQDVIECHSRNLI